MKRSAIYLEAAQIVDAEYSGCCVAISAAAHDDPHYFDCPEARAFARLFAPRRVHYYYWGEQWPIEERTDCRILALCFMSAIAGDEERNAK